MTSSHGRRIQGRRALAIMAWATLVIVAGLLWYGQHKRVIRIQAWEPAALLLSAYAAFLAIFGWLLFSPGRKSAEESPGLFFAGMLTLLPPCFIAYHLMPVGSPLKPWLTIGVFIFGIIAIMSPIPEEVFAVPRDRRTYLQPLTNAYLSELDVDAPEASFEDLAPRTAYWLSRPAPDPLGPAPGEAKDPWVDPFYGTGRQMSRIGVSQSRRSDESTRNDRRRLSDPLSGTSPSVPSRSFPEPPPLPPSLPASASARTAVSPPRSDRDSLDARDRSVGATPPLKPPSSVSPPSQSIPLPPLTLAGMRPDNNVRAPAEPSRPVTGSAAGSQPVPPSSRRPLTEPSGRSSSPVGFQTPQPSPSRVELPPTMSTASAPMAFPVPAPALSSAPVAIAAASAVAAASQSVMNSSVAAPVPLRTPLSPQLATNAPMPDLLRAITRADESPPLRDPSPLSRTSETSAASVRPAEPKPREPKPRELKPTEMKPAEFQQTLSAAGEELTAPVRQVSDLSLRELDQQIRAEESALADGDPMAAAADDRNTSNASDIVTERGTTSTSQQLSNDIRLERIRDEHGGEMIEGTIKVFFEQGQKRAHLHVPFSPPLAGLPEVECEPTGDDPIRLKVAVRQPYGVRIEARRAEASEALRTEISFAAVYTPSSRG